MARHIHLHIHKPARRTRDAQGEANIFQEGRSTFYYWPKGGNKIGLFASAEKARQAAKTAGFSVDASKGMQILERWYKQNPDDAGEYDVDEIMRRFGSSGVTLQEAQAMYQRIQKERYG